MATDRLSTPTTIIRKIQLIDRKDNSIFNEFLIKIEVEDKNDNVYLALKEKNITGTFEIINNGQVVVRSKAINGKEGEMEHFFRNSKVKNYGGGSGKISYADAEAEAEMANDCTWGALHNCVSNMIKDMGWAEYALCAVSAPECYVGLWVICSFKICRPHLGTNQL